MCQNGRWDNDRFTTDHDTVDAYEELEKNEIAGGLAFLEHAYIYEFEDAKKEIENIIKTTKIDGLECQYPVFSEKQTAEIIRLCQKYNKYMSGGSDYHAKNKLDIQIGTGKIRKLDKSIAK